MPPLFGTVVTRGSTPRRIPLTVNNAGACHKSTLNFIKSQIFSG